MDKLHLRGKNRWENKQVALGINEFPVFTGPESNCESTIYHQVQICAGMKSCGERERNPSQHHGFHKWRRFSLTGQKSCIDKGLLKIIVKDTSTSWLCFAHNRCLLGLGIYFQKIMMPKQRESPSADALVHLPKQGKATNSFSWGFLPKWGWLAKGPSFLKGPLLSQLVLAAWQEPWIREAQNKAVPAPKPLQTHQMWEPITGSGETKWYGRHK